MPPRCRYQARCLARPQWARHSPLLPPSVAPGPLPKSSPRRGNPHAHHPVSSCMRDVPTIMRRGHAVDATYLLV
ncbi:hypothetical protein B0H19DRAFT_1201010, partial [Mycena capillaripes]